MAKQKIKGGDCRMIWPMGAELAPDKAEKFLDDPNYIAEVKISGERLTITRVDHPVLKVRLFTRSGSKDCPDRPIEVTHRWPQIQKCNWDDVLVGTVLDGEGFSPLLREQEIAGMFNHRSEVPMPDHMRYICWDTVFLGDTSLEDVQWWSRRKTTERLVTLIGNPLIEVVAVCYEDKRKFLEFLLGNGGEGCVLKHINGFYYQGVKKANVWVKAKKKDTFDCIITGFKPGEGKYKGMVGSIQLSQYKKMGATGELEEYRLIPVCYASGITDELRTAITAEPDAFLGRIVVVDAYERQAGSVTLIQPRIKHFREEGSKDPRDCIIE